MLKQTLLDSWLFFSKNFRPISFIILPIVLPIEVFTAFYQYSPNGEDFVLAEQLIPTVLWIIGYPIYTAGLIFYIASTVSGESINTKAAWKLGIKFWLPYVIMSFLLIVAIILGFTLLIIPGIILSVRYSFSEFFLLLNQRTPFDAIKDSWATTKEYFWLILGGYLIISVLLYTPYYFILPFIDESSISNWIFTSILNTIYSILVPLYTIFTFRVYELAKSKHS